MKRIQSGGVRGVKVLQLVALKYHEYYLRVATHSIGKDLVRIKLRLENIF
jgi:hypothetical protein